jgi:hypothetical protein
MTLTRCPTVYCWLALGRILAVRWTDVSRSSYLYSVLRNTSVHLERERNWKLQIVIAWSEEKPAPSAYKYWLALLAVPQCKYLYSLLRACVHDTSTCTRATSCAGQRSDKASNGKMRWRPRVSPSISTMQCPRSPSVLRLSQPEGRHELREVNVHEYLRACLTS